MTILKWIALISICFVIYIITMIIISFIWYLIPSFEENIILELIVPTIINIIGIIAFFLAGHSFVSNTNLSLTSKINIILSIVMLFIQLIFLYLNYSSEKSVSKILASVIGCFISIGALYDSLKNRCC